jgi:hypothetical protein
VRDYFYYLAPFLLVSVAIMLVGCNPRQSHVDADYSFIDGTPCEPPCWHGIILDKSNRDDVYETIESLPFVKSESIREWSSNSSWIEATDEIEVFYSCTYMSDGICGGVRIVNNRVKSIWHWVGYRLTLEEVVDKLGDPSYWACIPIPGERMLEVTTLFWPDKGIIAEVHSLTCQINNEKVKPFAKVDVLEYVVRERFASQVDDPENWPRWEGFADW